MSAILAALSLLALGAVGSTLLFRQRAAGLLVALVTGALACLACVWAAFTTLVGTPVEPLEIHGAFPLGAFHLAVDGLSAWFLLMIGLVGFASAVYSWGYLGGGRGIHANRAYAPLFCLLLAAMVVTVCAADALVFLLGWEFTSLTAFFLVGLADEDSKARYGAWTYLVATHLGTALGVLPVFAAFIARTGGTAMGQYAGAFDAAGPVASAGIFVLCIVGFGTKAGIVPFHVWLPLAHPVAPSPVSALMSGVVVKIGIYGLIRAISWLPALPPVCGAGLLLLAAASALFGIACALGQRDLKRMLAYSTGENVGIVGMGIAVAMIGRSLDAPLLVACGMGGALLHALNHALFKGLLFLSAGAVLHGTGTGNMERLGGLARRTRLNSLLFLTGAIAICAMPPLNGFWGEYLIYSGLIHGTGSLPMSYGVVAGTAIALLALTGAIALVVFSKAVAVVFLGHPRDPGIHVHKTPITMNAGMAFLGAACVAIIPLYGILIPGLGAAVPGNFAPANGALDAVAALMETLWMPLGVFLAVAVLLWAIRGRLPKGRSNTTWGCGFSRPTSAMQYTGSSYGWSMLSAFRQLVRPARRVLAEPRESFPTPSELETTQEDLALDRIYRPVFVRIARLCERCWPLQHGRVQLYLVYVVATLLSVFLVEAWFAPYRTATLPSPPEAHRAALTALGAGTGADP